jgi:hypothetical protein
MGAQRMAYVHQMVANVLKGIVVFLAIQSAVNGIVQLMALVCITPNVYVIKDMPD